MRDELKLTPDQTRQLEQIQRETRTRVENILSQEQRQELAALPESAQSFHDVHEEMASLDTRARGEESMTESERSLAERPTEGMDESGIESIDREPTESAERPGEGSSTTPYSPGAGLSGRSQQ
jgi:hypothetical protein